MPRLTPAKNIRLNVLAMTQVKLAAALGVTQPVVSEWEKNGVIPARFQRPIRKMGKRQRPDIWSDSLFFEVPSKRAAA